MSADDLARAATLIAVLGAGLNAGVFFAFSTFVMRGLGQAPDEVGLRAMQEINRAAPSPAFMTLLFGTAGLSTAVAVAALVRDDPRAIATVTGAASYLCCVGLTLAYHVPRNDALAALDPTDPASAGAWRHYLASWTRANHVRTATAGLGSALLAIGWGAM